MGRSARGGYLAVVADGMGGHRSGEIASGKAVETMWEQFERSRSLPPLALAKSVRVTNQEIVSYASQHPESFGMGTTLTAVYIDDQTGVIAHAGDSRAYLIRGADIRQLTMDHSWVAERVRQGLLTEADARRHRYRNVITNALGTSSEIKLDVATLRLEEGDRILLCSDGVSMLLPDGLLLDLVKSGEPEEAVQRVIDQANERGSPDNVTAVLLELTSLEPRQKRYSAASDELTTRTISIGEGAVSGRQLEEAFEVHDVFAKVKKSPWYVYRFWLLGSAYLVLLIIIFTFVSR